MSDPAHISESVSTLLYPYSLVPVLSVAILLFFTFIRRGTKALGLSMYCLSVAFWSGMLVLIWVPPAAEFGGRMAATGSFISATFLHAAYDVTNQRSYKLVWFAYVVAAILTAAGAAIPGLLYDPVAMKAGSLFWPGMALAIAAASVPLIQLYLAYRKAPPEARQTLRHLGIAGALCYAGGMGNAVMLAHGLVLPYGMLLVLASLIVLANLSRHYQTFDERRLLERSLLYSAVAAFLSAGFLFGVMTLMSAAAEPFLVQYSVGALFLLFMASLAFEPIRQEMQSLIAGLFVKNRASAIDMAKALAEQENRAEQAQRLAEIGALASAVAHEVRNPLGVLSVHLKMLRRGGASEETTQAMQEQIDRAAHFAEDLLQYGRPRPLSIRMCDIAATIDLAVTTAKMGLGLPVDNLKVELHHESDEVLVEADQAQLQQALVILLDNALLALQESENKRLKISTQMQDLQLTIKIEDSGPGVPDALLERLFAPFVTGRKREGPRPGTGLGLAIAKGIIDRHHGQISAGRSQALEGALFVVTLPKVQPVLSP